MSDTEKHAADAAASVVNGLAKLYGDDPSCDFKIRCGVREWNVHKVILAIHSPVLAVAVTKDFKESKQGFIDLSEDNTEAGVEFHVKMCILADKYEILPLGTIAIDYFKEATTAASMSNSGCAGFCEAIRCAYGAAAVTQEIREHLVELIVECDAMGHAEFEGSALQAVMREYPDVAINVALASREPKRAITQPRYTNSHGDLFNMADFAQHAPAALESIAARLSKQTEGCLVDFSIKCGEREWKVHKVILAMHSPVLEAACTRDFQESKQGYIDLSAEDERSLEALVSYLYSFKYDSGLAAGDANFHVKMSILADKYDIPPLKAIASEWYKQSVNKNFIVDNREGFCNTLKSAYDAPAATKEIREHMIKLIIENKLDVTGFEQLMREYADFAADIAVAQQSKHKEFMTSDAVLKRNEKRVKCSGCANQWICPIATPPLPINRCCSYCGQRMMETQWQLCVVKQ